MVQIVSLCVCIPLRACSKWQYFDVITTTHSSDMYVSNWCHSWDVTAHAVLLIGIWSLTVLLCGAFYNYLADDYIVWHGIWQRCDDKNSRMIQSMILYPHILRQRGTNIRIQWKLNVNCFDNNSYRCHINCAFHENILFPQFCFKVWFHSFLLFEFTLDRTAEWNSMSNMLFSAASKNYYKYINFYFTSSKILDWCNSHSLEILWSFFFSDNFCSVYIKICT